jgi:hypothetical protein
LEWWKSGILRKLQRENLFLTHDSIIPSLHCSNRFLWQIALQIDGFLFVDMGSLIANHGDPGMPIEIIVMTLTAVIDQKVFLLSHKL